MLEFVVRPFASPNAQANILIPSAPSGATQPAILRWGATATMPAAQPAGVNIVCCKEQVQEQSRESDTVKITNPSDASQFVMVKRAKSLSLKKQENMNGCGDDNSFSTGNFEFSGSAEISAALDVPSTCSIKLSLKNQ